MWQSTVKRTFLIHCLPRRSNEFHNIKVFVCYGDNIHNDRDFAVVIPIIIIIVVIIGLFNLLFTVAMDITAIVIEIFAHEALH